jgi:hypothetical protein
MAVVDAAKEDVWMKKLLTELGMVPSVLGTMGSIATTMVP